MRKLALLFAFAVLTLTTCAPPGGGTIGGNGTGGGLGAFSAGFQYDGSVGFERSAP
jgi:hypothetical protein